MPTRFEQATQQPRRARLWIEIGETPDAEWFRVAETFVAAEIDAALALVTRALMAQPATPVLESLHQKLQALRREVT